MSQEEDNDMSGQMENIMLDFDQQRFTMECWSISYIDYITKRVREEEKNV